MRQKIKSAAKRQRETHHIIKDFVSNVFWKVF